MKSSRRTFLKTGAVTLAGISVLKEGFGNGIVSPAKSDFTPIVISTWDFGLPANDEAWKIISAGGYALDAVEAGVKIPEADPKVNTVGYGGIPDAKGKVTLDASIMNEKLGAGAVAFLEHIKHPISVARLVMEKTPHVMLCGKGALKFALKNGFEKVKLLTPEQKANWKKWKKEKKQKSKSDEKNHDTIGMIALDKQGRLCGACTTSGMGYKLRGRVGDSPIIGAGLYVDGEVGGAAATGTGELVMRTLGSFLVVELMRNGMSPGDACREAVARIAKKIPDSRQNQVGFIALNKNGEHGAFCIQPGFNYAVKSNAFSGLVKAESYLKLR
jgi:N4-(beta-N-acetylglucosaminyl)-L-asparaginase